MKTQSTSNSKNTLKKLEDSLFLDLKFTTIVLNTMGNDRKDRHIGQQNRDLRNQTSYIQSNDFDKCDNTINRVSQYFQQNSTKNTGHPNAKEWSWNVLTKN